MKDEFIARLVSFITRSVYRDVQVYIAPGVRRETPTLTVANHFGGVADALVLLDVMPRRPGIIARDVIWRVPVVGALMNWIGAIPVHKPEDRGAESSNDQMFSSCYSALELGGQLLIFPEGVTRNEPSIAEVKTGAARIALGARAHGARDLAVIPVGIHYEDKAALRSRVFVNVGTPIELDEYVGGLDGGSDVDANDREAVRQLTDEIDRRLRRAAPDFDDWTEAQLLTHGADVTLRSFLDSPSVDVDFGLRDRLANTLADRPAGRRSAICEAVVEYRDELDAVGYSDAELHSRLTFGRLTRSLLWQALVGIFLLPFALAGAVINVIPYAIVKAVGKVRAAPSMLSTLKPIAAVGAFGVTWAVVIWLAARNFGWEAGVVAFILLPVYLAAAIVLVERVALMWRLLRRHRAATAGRGISGELAVRRAAVVEAVLAA